MHVSDNEELSVSALQVFTDEGGPLIPPDIDRIVRTDNNELALMDTRRGEASALDMDSCDPLFHSDTLNARISQGNTEWLCLLYSDGLESARDDFMAMAMDHWKGVVWDPYIVGQQCLHVCCDCLYLMALFRAMMLVVHDWAAWSYGLGLSPGIAEQ